MYLRLGSLPSWANESSREQWYVSPHRDERQQPILTVWRLESGFFLLRYCDRTEFLVHPAGKEVWAAWPPEATLEDTATYLLGPVLGFVLRLRGTVCLHASAVAVEGRAIALLGPAGAGKSTAAAAFALRGYPVLTEDVLPLREQEGSFLVQPGYPRIRLWPESVELLFGASDVLPPLTPTWDKRYLETHAFEPHPLPLGAIYLLDVSEDRAGPLVEALPAPLITLIANTYTTYLLDREQRAHEFRVLSRLLHSVPLRKVHRPRDPTCLPRFCDAILDDFQELIGSSRITRDAKEDQRV